MSLPWLRGIRVFLLVWLGQLLSLVGSGLTSFALGLWVIQSSHKATPFALIALFTVLPSVILAPLAGALVDRFDRRNVMLISDAGAALSTLVLAVLMISGELQLWQVYLASAMTGLCATFQQPAYLAATSMLVPERQLGRVSGLIQLAQAASDVLAPAAAGALVMVVKVHGVLLIDLLTFAVAVMTLLVVRFPRPEPVSSGEVPAWSLYWGELVAGWRFIASRPGLVALLALLAMTCFGNGIIGALLMPLLLSLSDALGAGTVISVAGTGMVLGSAAMSVWQGPQRRIGWALGGDLVKGIAIMMMGLRPSAWLVAAAATVAHTALPIANAARQAIWLRLVPSGLQGRVLAMRHVISRAAMPLAFLIAGPVVDCLLEPAMTDGGALASSLGWMLGAGNGRGIGLMFVMMGTLIAVTSAAGFLMPQLQQLEDETPKEHGGERAA